MGKRKSENPRKIVALVNEDDSDSDTSTFESKFVGKETYRINESYKLNICNNRTREKFTSKVDNMTLQNEIFEDDYTIVNSKLCNTIASNLQNDNDYANNIPNNDFTQSLNTMVVFPDMIKSGILTTNIKRETVSTKSSFDDVFYNSTSDKNSYNFIENYDMDDPLDLSVEQSDSASNDSWNNKDNKKFQSFGNYVPRRRNQTYPPTFKLAVVQYAEKHGVMSAARYYDVSPKRIRVWRTNNMKQTIIKKVKKQGLDVLGVEAASSTEVKEKSCVQTTSNKDRPIDVENVNKCNEVIEKPICDMSYSGKYCCKMKEKTTETQNRTIPVWEVELFATVRKQLNSKNSIKIKKLLETAKKLQPSSFQEDGNSIPTLWIVQWCLKFGVGFETNKCCDICAIPKELTENIVIRKVKPTVAGQGIVEKPKKLRKTYSPDFKLQVAEFALHNTQRAAARKFGVAQKRVFAWVLAKDELQETWHSNDHHEQEQKQVPEKVENILWKWYTDMQSKGKDVSKRMICAQARFQFKKLKNYNFVGNNQWYNSWVKRMKKKGHHLNIPGDNNNKSVQGTEIQKVVNKNECS